MIGGGRGEGENEKRRVIVEYRGRQAHVPSAIKEHNLKVATELII